MGFAATMAVVASLARADTQRLQDVPFELGNAGFDDGDQIQIASVRGTSARFEAGGTYAVCGTYRLESRGEATLALFVTNGAVGGANLTRVARGVPTPFCLEMRLDKPGFPHASYYPARGGDSFGGVYFGTGTTVYRGSYVPGRDVRRRDRIVPQEP